VILLAASTSAVEPALSSSARAVKRVFPKRVALLKAVTDKPFVTPRFFKPSASIPNHAVNASGCFVVAVSRERKRRAAGSLLHDRDEVVQAGLPITTERVHRGCATTLFHRQLMFVTSKPTSSWCANKHQRIPIGPTSRIRFPSLSVRVSGSCPRGKRSDDGFTNWSFVGPTLPGTSANDLQQFAVTENASRRDAGEG
jgi:hypothetical protein